MQILSLAQGTCPSSKRIKNRLMSNDPDDNLDLQIIINSPFHVGLPIQSFYLLSVTKGTPR